MTEAFHTVRCGFHWEVLRTFRDESEVQAAGMTSLLLCVRGCGFRCSLSSYNSWRIDKYYLSFPARLAGARASVLD